MLTSFEVRGLNYIRFQLYMYLSFFCSVSLLYVRHLTGLSHCSMCFILLDCHSLLYVLHLTGLSHCSMCFILLDCLTALCDSSYWTVSLLYVLHLTGLSHCSMCFIILDCLTALCDLVCVCLSLCQCDSVRVSHTHM